MARSIAIPRKRFNVRDVLRKSQQAKVAAVGRSPTGAAQPQEALSCDERRHSGYRLPSLRDTGRLRQPVPPLHISSIAPIQKSSGTRRDPALQ
jgi:hypothetical protein